MQVNPILLLFSILLTTNNSFASETPIIICKNDKETYFIKAEAIYYLMIGNGRLGVHNGFIATDTEGKKRLLLQDSPEEVCVLGEIGGET